MTNLPEWGPPIPGETPIDDISGLKHKSVRTRAQLNIVEAQNIQKPTLKYLSGHISKQIAPFTYEWVFRLHGEMFGDVWEWAGSPRQKDVNRGYRAYQIPDQLEQLLRNLKSWPGFGMSLAQQAAELHHKAVSIHPFMNGNGRWSRMLANIWLRLAGEAPIAWPADSIGAESTIRKDYLAALKKADDGDFGELISLQAQFAVRK
jgi:Fic-DOC domain mobile mystery protein B